MSDLDVIREARDYLAGLIERSGSDKWEAVQWKSGAAWRIDAGDDRITLDTEGGEVFHESDARLIVALRAAAPFLLGAMDEAIEFWGYLDEPGRALALARAILATKGQDDD